MDIQKIVGALMRAGENIEKLSEEVEQLRQEVAELKKRVGLPCRPRQSPPTPVPDEGEMENDAQGGFSAGSNLSTGDWGRDLQAVKEKVREEIKKPERDRWRIAKRDGMRFPVYVKRWGGGIGCRAIVPVGNPEYFYMEEVAEKLTQGV